MKIIISEKDKNVLVEFHYKGVVDTDVIDKAEDFLLCVDRFTKKRKIKLTTLSPFGRSPVGGQRASLKFSAQGGPASG